LDEAIFMSRRILVLSARPGRVKRVLTVGLPKNRTPEMRKCREFHELRTVIWDLLREPLPDEAGSVPVEGGSAMAAQPAQP